MPFMLSHGIRNVGLSWRMVVLGREPDQLCNQIAAPLTFFNFRWWIVADTLCKAWRNSLNRKWAEFNQMWIRTSCLIPTLFQFQTNGASLCHSQPLRRWCRYANFWVGHDPWFLCYPIRNEKTTNRRENYIQRWSEISTLNSMDTCRCW